MIFWIQDHLLEIVSIMLILILFYHYIIEKNMGVNLSKRYRDAIYESQSQFFLNATRHLLIDRRDLAIKEFLKAIERGGETLEISLTLATLLRADGQFDESIGIHRSLIARADISESNRLRVLKELAIDFDKGGFVDKAIETYQEVLKLNCDQYDVLLSLCHIFESLEDWDQAYRYRFMLSKLSHKGQNETISHILVQKAQQSFKRGDFKTASSTLENALYSTPSVAAKILQVKIDLLHTDEMTAQKHMIEFLREYPLYASFIFESLEDTFEGSEEIKNTYKKRLDLLKKKFLLINDVELNKNSAVILTKIRLLKSIGDLRTAYLLMYEWFQDQHTELEEMRVEYMKLLISLGKTDLIMKEMHLLLQQFYKTQTKHYCRNCGYNSDNLFWRCPQCYLWETMQFRWKI